MSEFPDWVMCRRDELSTAYANSVETREERIRTAAESILKHVEERLAIGSFTGPFSKEDWPDAVFSVEKAFVRVLDILIECGIYIDLERKTWLYFQVPGKAKEYEDCMLRIRKVGRP